MKLGSCILGLVLGLTGVIAACGDDAAEKAAEQARQEQQAQDMFLDTYCQIILKCCNQVLSLPKDDVAGCKTRLAKLDPVTPKNEKARTDCITQVKKAVQVGDFCEEFEHADMPACPDGHRAKLLGMKKPGEACAKVDDCAPAFEGIVDCVGSVCQVRKRGKDGDGPCDRTIDGDVVWPASVVGEEAAAGAAVFDCYRSIDALQCDPVAKKCKPAGAAKSKCEHSEQCKKTDFCAGDEKQCFTKLGKDSACDKDDECQGHCMKKGDGAFCTDPAAEGGDCKDNFWCKAGLQCDDGKCAKPGPDARLAATCK